MPGSRACVCACSSWSARARSGAPHLFLWPSCPSSLFGPLRAGVARASAACFFLPFLPFAFLLSFPLPSRAPVVSRCPGPWRPAVAPTAPLCVFVSSVFSPLAPLPLFFSSFLLCAPHPLLLCLVFSLFPSLFSGVVVPPPPIPPPFFFLFLGLPFPCAPSPRLSCLGFSVVSGLGCPGPWRSISALPSRRLSLSVFCFLSSFLAFSFCFFCFSSSFSSLPLFPGSGRSPCSWPLVRLAGFLRPSPCAAVRVVRALRAGAAVCAMSCWCCPLASFALAGAVCCCLWLRVVRCWVWLSVVGFRWRALARVVIPGRVVRRPAVCFGLLWLPCAVSCVLWLCVAVWPRAVVPWCPFCFVLWSVWRCAARWRRLRCVVLFFGWCFVPASCARVGSLLGLVACLPCCIVRAGWCCVLLPVVAGCSSLGLVACCCVPLACVASVALTWPRGLLPCCVLWFVVVPVRPALLLVPRAVVCRCVWWCLPWCVVLRWCCSGVSWCHVVPCRVLWCCVALRCRAAGVCCVFCFASGVRFSFQNHFFVFGN